MAPLMDAVTPKLNPTLANGLAVAHIPQSEAHVDSVWRAVARGFPSEFEYVRTERCTPQEEFDELTRKKNNKRYFDVAVSDIYMMRYVFRHRGEEINRYIKLPFVGPAGSLHVSGSRFIISPVHADTAISILPTNIFVRLIRAKVTFEREQQHYMVEGIRETAHVAWSEIYNKNKKTAEMKPAIDAHTTIVHYLFCKFGATETFRRYGHCTPQFGNKETITKETHPEKDWVICSSTQVKPNSKSYKLKFYVPSTVVVAIPRAQYEHPQHGQTIKNMVCGFFYIVDHFPTRVKAEWVDRESNWMILLGHLIWGSNVGDGRILSDVIEHIGSLDEYIDEIMRLKFIEIGMPIDDIYQLFGIILEKFNDWLLGAADSVSSMYGKELNILYYVLGDITKQINKFYFKLKSAYNSKRDPANAKREMTKKEIENLMNSTISPGLIYAITRTHGEVSTVSSSGDNMAFKITSMLVAQANSTRQKGKSDNATIQDPTKRLHVSVAEIGGYSNLPKSEPSGHSRLNLCTRINAKGVVLQDPELKLILDPVQEMIKRQ